jgi:hypothetical protein
MECSPDQVKRISSSMLHFSSIIFFIRSVIFFILIFIENPVKTLFVVEIRNTINKVQCVDFKLENVLVSLHSLKTMGLGPFGASAPLSLRNGDLLGHSPIQKLNTKCSFGNISLWIRSNSPFLKNNVEF